MGSESGDDELGSESGEDELGSESGDDELGSESGDVELGSESGNVELGSESGDGDGEAAPSEHSDEGQRGTETKKRCRPERNSDEEEIQAREEQ